MYHNLCIFVPQKIVKMKTEVIKVRIDIDLKEKLTKLDSNIKPNLSKQIRDILGLYVSGNGFVPQIKENVPQKELSPFELKMQLARATLKVSEDKVFDGVVPEEDIKPVKEKLHYDPFYDDER